MSNWHPQYREKKLPGLSLDLFGISCRYLDLYIQYLSRKHAYGLNSQSLTSCWPNKEAMSNPHLPPQVPSPSVRPLPHHTSSLQSPSPPQPLSRNPSYHRSSSHPGVAITDFAFSSSSRTNIRRRVPYSPRITPAPSIWTPSRPASPTEDPTAYDVSDLRDGFFDAFFVTAPPPGSAASSELRKTLPERFDSLHPLSISDFVPRQWHGLRSAVVRVATTRAGVRLTRSFAAFFVAYALCLAPESRAWLGRHAYLACVSTLINHPGRTFGAQLDGTVATIVGTALGLGWGALGLLLSTSTQESRAGYGGILAMFISLFMLLAAILRSSLIRFHQLVLCGGLAISYTCLYDSSGDTIIWPKLWAYAHPWLVGQAIALVVVVLIFPDAGARPLATALHEAFKEMDVCQKFDGPDHYDYILANCPFLGRSGSTSTAKYALASSSSPGFCRSVDLVSRHAHRTYNHSIRPTRRALASKPHAGRAAISTCYEDRD